MGKSPLEIDVYRMRIMAKLELPGCSDLVRHAISQTLQKRPSSGGRTLPRVVPLQ
jgi:hypothetical protein